MPDGKGCAYGEVTRTMLLDMQKNFDKFYNNDFHEVKTCVLDIKKNITNIEKNQSARPSWAVSIIIILLSSTCTGLIVAFAKVLGGG